MRLTPAHVIRAYRLLLDRNPESDEFGAEKLRAEARASHRAPTTCRRRTSSAPDEALGVVFRHTSENPISTAAAAT